MTYIRSLFLNFLIVFFIDRVAPGLEISYFEQVPNIGADVLFSFVVGFLNASIFPILVALDTPITKKKIALLSALISFGSFALIARFPFGVRVLSWGGFFFGGTVVWAGAFFSNYLEFLHNQPKSK